MAYSELIKNFDKIRDYMRDFYVYSFKSREHTGRKRTLTLELVDERNALERVMLHFSHFEKTAQQLDDKHYRLNIKYYQSDETEILIRILSFGPMVRVIEPQRFVNMIKNRLKRQKSCGL